MTGRVLVRWLLILSIATPLVLLGLAGAWWYLPSVPELSADRVEFIEVHLERCDNPDIPDNQQKETTVSTAHPQQIQALLDVFQTAKRTSDHKCGSSGTLTIHKRNGSVQTLGILPGHDPACYEYRYGTRINQVDRPPFLAALKAIGVDQIKESPP
jgi:hypothetical protein